MEDLRLAIVLMALLSVAVFFGVNRLSRGLGPRWLDALAVVIVLLIALYVRWVWGELWIVEYIPLASVIVLSNWFPLLLGALAAVLWLRMRPHPLWRRIPVQALLIGVTVWSVIYVIPRNPPECGNEWIDLRPYSPYRICRQTTPWTCSAAASATILEALGINATEAEMARLCLTRHGTSWLGMYHGLKIKLQGSGYAPVFFDGTVDDLDAITDDHPALLCCQLTTDVAAENPAYANDHGWIPGVAHSVVCFGMRGPVVVIGDPSQRELEHWNLETLGDLWTGSGLRITESH